MLPAGLKVNSVIGLVMFMTLASLHISFSTTNKDYLKAPSLSNSSDSLVFIQHNSLNIRSSY